MVELPYEKLTIYECEDFYKFLIGKLKTVDTSLSLDFKNIQKIDMVTIQLLLSLANTCKKTDVELNLINFSRFTYQKDLFYQFFPKKKNHWLPVLFQNDRRLQYIRI